MQKRHKNKHQYFEEQGVTTGKFVIPFLREFKNTGPEISVLEIGCGEAGNLKPFLESGCRATGIDISCHRIDLAIEFYKNHPNRNNLALICEDIYNVKPEEKYDIIIMRDVIEHIPNQENFMGLARMFLKPDGVFFLAFPPWQNPFGGHQQLCRNKILSVLPWFHLLPRAMYRFVLKVFGETRGTVDALLEIKDTGISIERFEQILKKEKYRIRKREFYFINPNYETKFGLKPRRQVRLIASIPWVRNFFTTAMYYVVSK